MAATEELLEAGNAFVQTLVGDENFVRLLALKTKYQFQSIPDCIHWMLLQMESLDKEDEDYRQELYEEKSCEPSSGHKDSQQPDKQQEPSTSNISPKFESRVLPSTHNPEGEGSKEIKKERSPVTCEEDIQAYANFFPDEGNKLPETHTTSADRSGSKRGTSAPDNLDGNGMGYDEMQDTQNFEQFPNCLDAHSEAAAADMATFSNDIIDIPCIVCNINFQSLADISQHFRDFHADLERSVFMCNFCGKQYRNRSSLHYHKDLHMGRRFRCEICGKFYRHSISLSNHKKINHNVYNSRKYTRRNPLYAT